MGAISRRIEMRANLAGQIDAPRRFIFAVADSRALSAGDTYTPRRIMMLEGNVRAARILRDSHKFVARTFCFENVAFIYIFFFIILKSAFFFDVKFLKKCQNLSNVICILFNQTVKKEKTGRLQKRTVC